MPNDPDAATTKPWTRNLQGPAGQLFGDPAPGPDETAFQVDNTSDTYYNSPYYKQHESDVLAIPLGPPSQPLALSDVVGTEFLAPIFAIPGNHDGEVTYLNGGTRPDVPTLQAFIANFCTPAPQKPQDGGGLARTTMTQPGVYFTLDAPMVSIIGIYTNVLEGPGVLTDQGGQYPALKDDQQYAWLVSELQRLAPLRRSRERGVILACHHPPASADITHGGTTGLADDLDRAFTAGGLWPDAIISGHAHIYQRFQRSAGGRQIPYIVAGSGGHAVTVPPGENLGEAPRTWNEYTLLVGPTAAYGYLTATVDMSGSGTPTLTLAFTAPGVPGAGDSVAIELS